MNNSASSRFCYAFKSGGLGTELQALWILLMSISYLRKRKLWFEQEGTSILKVSSVFRLMFPNRHPSPWVRVERISLISMGTRKIFGMFENLSVWELVFTEQSIMKVFPYLNIEKKCFFPEYEHLKFLIMSQIGETTKSNQPKNKIKPTPVTGNSWTCHSGKYILNSFSYQGKKERNLSWKKVFIVVAVI